VPGTEASRPRVRPQALAFGVIAGGFVATTLGALLSIIATPQAFGLDTTAYIEAAKRLIATGTPYADALRGGPIEHAAENIPIAYLYPPPLAQLFVPVAHLPHELLVAVWLAAQTIALTVLMVALVRRYHPQPFGRSTGAVLLAAGAFAPTQIAIYIGNVSGWIGIATAVVLLAGPFGRSIAGSIAAWLKVISGALALGALMDPSTRRSAGVAIAAIPIASAVVAPAAWLDFVAVLPNLVRTPAAEAVRTSRRPGS
jgi:hypothetical protein